MRFTIRFSYLYWIALSLILVFFHMNHPLNSDEGIVLAGCWDMFNGKDLYFDFFEFIPPGAFYFLYWWWLLLTPSYILARAVFLALLFAAAFGLWRLSRLVKKSPLNYLPPLIFVLSTIFWPIINYHTLSITAVIWASYWFFLGWHERSEKKIILAGLATCLAILALQPRGIVLLIGLSLFLISMLRKNKKTNQWKLLLFYLISSLAPLLVLLFKWPASVLFTNLIAFPLNSYLAVSVVSFNLLIFFLVILFFVIWLLWAESSPITKGLLWLQLILLLSTASLADHYHILLILFPLYALLPLLTQKLKTLKRLGRLSAYALLSLAALVIFLPGFFHLYRFPPFYSVTNHPVIAFIQDNCQHSDYLFAGPFIPGLYFETKKQNPTSYAYLIHNHNTDEHFIRARDELAQNPPGCAILNYSIVAKYNHDRNNPVENFIREHYELIYEKHNFLIYKLP